MERQQNIRTAGSRRVGANFALETGDSIEQEFGKGGQIILTGNGPEFCNSCGGARIGNISCCGM